MVVFACRTRADTGEIVEKTIEAETKREAIALLEGSGLTPVSITVPADPTAPAAQPASFSVSEAPASKRARGKVKRKELMQFSQQLSTALGAGVPILASLRSIRSQTRTEAFASALGEIIADLEHGSPLSEAMEKHPKVFPSSYVGTIEAGEKSSTLDEMLENLAEYLEAEMEIRSDVRSAVMYPCIVISTLCIAIGVLIVFVVPRFAAFYSGFDAELPLATRLLIDGSSFMADNFVFVLGALGGLVYGALRALRVPKVRFAFDAALMRIPFIGTMVETAITLHVIEMLGLFTRAGVPVLDGMRTIAGTTSNMKYRADLVNLTELVAVGQTLAASMETANCFPTSARQMLANGEATGSLERACFSVSRHYKKELRYLTKNVATFIEPLLTLFLAVVVLFVALAAFLPMWDLVKIVGK